ncbi:MAG TPA: mycofactocin-associated electron transfer flavoprotein beta subunit [Acidimicrobiales bacterium]
MIGACLKWVDRRPEVDPLTGAVATDPRTSGASEADAAALEWGLRLGEAWGDEVVAVTAGPAAAEALLREALAAGAARAVRVDLPAGAPSEAVAAGLAGALAGAQVVVCGDWSLDRGSGAVPAYLAAHLGAAQALGLVDLAPGEPGSLRAERRLDGGRRERLAVAAPMVLSVEGRTRLRRARLAGVLAARDAEVALHPGPPVRERPPARTAPYRPRARVLPPPGGRSPRERVLVLTGALADRTPPEQAVLDPGAAADRILDQLRAWGYLDR